MLTQEVTKVSADARFLTTCIYGEAGIGKSTFLAQIPDSYYIYTSRTEVEGLQVVGALVENFTQFIDVCVALREAKEAGWPDQREVKVVIIDTYDQLFDYAGAAVVKSETFMIGGKSQKFSRVSEVPYGLGNVRASETVLDAIFKLRALGFGVFVGAHQRERATKWKGQQVTQIEPDLTPTSAKMLVNAMGVVGLYTAEEEFKKVADKDGNIVIQQRQVYRYLSFQPEFKLAAKHRLRYFPKQLQINVNDGWMTYKNAFDKAYAEEFGNND